MKKSTQHAIAQRVIALMGFILGMLGLYAQEFGFYISLLGFGIISFAIISAFGIGPWGRYYTSLVIADHDAYLKSLEPKQPWQ